jgi:phosphoribosylamine-glycine ligase
MLEEMGKRVFGCRNADKLENYRDKTKELLKKLKQPVGPYKIIIGLPDLRTYLKGVKDKYLKINLWRGNGETRKSTNYKIIETLLDRWEWELGPLKYEEKFIIEDEIPGEEIGTDRWFTDEGFPKSYLAGIEVKGMGYFGVIKKSSELPKQMTSFGDAIAPTLKEAGYRGFYSEEIRVGENKIAHMNDLCVRCPSPPSDLYINMYNNLPDIIWECAEGRIREPEYDHKYGVQAMIYADWSEFNFQCIEFPEKYRDNIKMRYAMKTKEGYYIIPFKGNTRLCAVVATGDSFEECSEKIIKIQKEIKSFDKDFNEDTLSQAKKSFKQVADWGMKID